MEFDLRLARDFAIALFIGALIGIEREKRKTSDEPVGIGGIRTFILIAQAGAVSAWLSGQLETPWVFAATLLAVALAVLAGYFAQVRAHPSSVGRVLQSSATRTRSPCTLLSFFCTVSPTSYISARRAQAAGREPSHCFT